MIENPSPGRRRFLKLAGGFTAVVALSATFLSRAVAALPHLSASTNPTAKALHYTDDASEAVVHHPPMQHCMMCQHYKGHMGETWGPCEIFPGYDVNAKGWCSAYKARESMMHMMHMKP
ncbi:MAG: High potential iron-sulfur protein [Rhodanobacter sp.]|nr:MAG: High potential iron-sulfur protein [Rhodanobacter sp.]